LRAIVVGGGPVGCLVARELRKRSIEVDIYEKGQDPRLPRDGNSHSFNLTLTLRGLTTLDEQLQEVLYQQGVRCPHRVIHNEDGTITVQPYGTAPEHHLLSIPRNIMHRRLLTEAEAAGARLFFGHKCMRVDTRNARAGFVENGSTVHEVQGDLVFGCDGANSIVRHEMTGMGARLDVRQEFIQHHYIELHMPPGRDRWHALPKATPGDTSHGLHIWPRGEFVLIAQPNQDNSYTATLFMPLEPAGDRPGLRQLTTAAAVEAFFYRHFADAWPLIPELTRDFFAAPPASLKIVRCTPFHHGRTVLLGDAAHTMVPFYGQGINCSFEDVATLFELFDRALLHAEPQDAVLRALAAFTDARTGPSEAITALSRANLEELSARTSEREYHARKRVERRLHELYPDHFVPLYQRIAFSNIPYDVALELYERDSQTVTELLKRFDPEAEQDKIYRAFGEAVLSPAPAATDG